MTYGKQEARKLFLELLKEFTEYMTESGAGAFVPVMMRKYYIYDPADAFESDCTGKIRILQLIHGLLCENEIKSTIHGYTYLKDAISLVIDIGSMDICLSNDIYPLIAKKHGTNEYSVEHNIRNALDAAYRTSMLKAEEDRGPMGEFKRKPKNKEFILMAARRVQDMLLRELIE